MTPDYSGVIFLSVWERMDKKHKEWNLFVLYWNFIGGVWRENLFYIKIIAGKIVILKALSGGGKIVFMAFFKYVNGFELVCCSVYCYQNIFFIT